MAKDLMKVAPDYPTIRQLFETKTIQEQLKLAAASTVRIDQMARVFLSVIRNNSKLLESTQQSLLTCLFAFAQMGLSPEPFLGQAYAVPFWNGRIKAMEAQFIPGYRGLIVLARRSGELNNLVAQNVFSNDKFDIRFGLHEQLDHVPVNGNRGEFIGSWTKFSYYKGDPTFEYMTKSDIDKIMERTKSKDRDGNIMGPWVTDYEEMSKKTVIKRHMKLAPLSVEDHSIARAAYAEDLALTGKSQSGLFLPDSDDEDAPIQVEFRNFDQEFDALFGNIDKKLMAQYLDAVSKGNNEPIAEVKKSAVDNQESFLQYFKQWESNQKEDANKDKKTEQAKKKSTPKKKGPGRPKKSEAKKKDKQDDKKSAESENEQQSEPEDSGGDDGDDQQQSEMSFDEIIQTNEWNELSLLKEQYPKFYLKTLKGQTPRTMDALVKAIDDINNLITESGEDGIPGS